MPVDTKTSALAAADTPLTGDEKVPIVQAGVSKQATTQDIANLGGEIPNPADNEAGGVNITSALGYVRLISADGTQLDLDSGFYVQAASDCPVEMFAGASGSSTGARLQLFSAISTEGGTARLWAGNSGAGAGGDVDIAAGNGTTTNGSLKLSVASGGYIELNGMQKISNGTVANNAQNVTYGNVGPGSSALTIKKWEQVVEGSTTYYRPLFGV